MLPDDNTRQHKTTQDWAEQDLHTNRIAHFARCGTRLTSHSYLIKTGDNLYFFFTLVEYNRRRASARHALHPLPFCPGQVPDNARTLARAPRLQSFTLQRGYVKLVPFPVYL